MAIETLDRRAFLKSGLAAGAGLIAGQVAVGGDLTEKNDPNAFVFSRLKFRTTSHVTDMWDVLPDCDETMLNFIRQTTNIRLSEKTWKQRSLDIKELGLVYAYPERRSPLYSCPFLFMTCGGDFALNGAETSTLAEYFRRGGFLYADDCVENGHSYFYHCFIKEINKVLPGVAMRPVPHEHDIYHCLHDFPNGAPYHQGERRPDMGLFYHDRLAAFLTSGDIHCGWLMGRDRTQFHKMGANIVIHALTH